MQEAFKAGEKVRVIGRVEVGTVLGVNLGRVGVRYDHENGAVTHGNYDLKYVERVGEASPSPSPQPSPQGEGEGKAAKPKATTKDLLPPS